MTREEAISIIERVIHTEAKWPGTEDTLEALDLALSALRPVSREQVEKVYPGCAGCNDRRCTTCKFFGWYQDACKQCEFQSNYQPLNFCPHCGKPLRDEAMQILIERMEELKNGSTSD